MKSIDNALQRIKRKLEGHLEAGYIPNPWEGGLNRADGPPRGWGAVGSLCERSQGSWTPAARRSSTRPAEVHTSQRQSLGRSAQLMVISALTLPSSVRIVTCTGN